MDLLDYIREKHFEVHNRLKPGMSTFFPEERMKAEIAKAEEIAKKTEEHRMRMKALAEERKRKKADGKGGDDDDDEDGGADDLGRVLDKYRDKVKAKNRDARKMKR